MSLWHLCERTYTAYYCVNYKYPLLKEQKTLRQASMFPAFQVFDEFLKIKSH